jgi:hypothetical protein
MTKHGTIIGPKGTETIISMSELTNAGNKVEWKESEVEVTEIGEQPFASFNYRKLEDCKYYPKDI